MTNLQIIIQARMTSTRLPGKVMLPLMGKPVLEIMLERLKPLQDLIIIATTNDGTEQPIVELCERLNIRYFKGSTDDVLSRYYNAACKFGANDNTIVLRLTSDCPLIDPALVQTVINKLLQSSFDMVSLGPHSGFPRGLDCCGFFFRTLANTHKLATSIPDREHVTLGMAKFQSLNVHNVSAGEDLSDVRLTLDESDDYLAIQAIYAQMNNTTSFSYESLIDTLKKNPHLSDINKHVEQKKV